MAGIVLERVSRFFAGGVVAVDAIDLEVNDKEFLVLVGPSGCGKTTTLRMIAGLEEISAGEIRIGERRVNELPPKNRDIAMVFQNYALYPHMTVRRNMGFALELRRGVSHWRQMLWRVVNPRRGARLVAQRREIDDQVDRTARLLGIEGLLERLPRQLSGGERQRVALGRAIVRRPVAFLFDEPLSNLDARLRVEMRRELKELHRRLATTMVYVTHDQVEALTLGDRIVVMDHGVIQQIGAPMELYDRPRNRFVAGFLGSPPMNFLEGSLEASGDSSGEGLSLRDGERNCLIQLGPELSARIRSLGLRRCVLGVRPEDVRLSAALPEAKGQEAGRRGARGAGVVHLVESLGDATLVSVRVGGVLVGYEPAGRIVADENRVPGANTVDSSSLQSGEGGAPDFVIGKMDARTTFRGGERVWVEFASERTHVFDADTGLNLIGASEKVEIGTAIAQQA